MTKALVLISAILLTGCSAIGPAVLGKVIGGSDPMLGIDTEVVAGDKVQSVQVDTIQATQSFDEVEVKGDLQVTSATQKGNRDIVTDNYTEGIPYWQVALGGITLLLVGMFMPQFAVRRKSK